MREIFAPKTQKTGLGLAMIAIPKPVFSGFTVFWAIFALKTRKLPDLSGRQIRQLICDSFTRSCTVDSRVSNKYTFAITQLVSLAFGMVR